MTAQTPRLESLKQAGKVKPNPLNLYHPPTKSTRLRQSPDTQSIAASTMSCSAPLNLEYVGRDPLKNFGFRTPACLRTGSVAVGQLSPNMFLYICGVFINSVELKFVFLLT